MTQLRIGFNINGANAGDTAAIVEWHRVNKPAWALVMDDADLAVMIKAASPTTNVIIRSYADTGHEDTYRKLTPEGFIQKAIQQGAAKDVWIQVGNESGFSDELLNWTARVIELAAEHNQVASNRLKLVVLNHAVGTPANINDWKRAAAVKVLKLASKYREWCVIGLHEYFNIVPTSGFRGGNPTWIQPEDWPENPYTVGALWHCGRFQFALDSCRENDITPYPRMVLTEHGTDDVSDIKAWAQAFNVGETRGWKQAAKVWDKLYNGKAKEETYAEMLRYLDEHLYRNSPVEGQLLFTLSKSLNWWMFDCPEMLGHIAAPVDTPPPAPQPEPPVVVVDVPAHPGLPTTVTNTSDGARVLRAKALLSGAYLRVIKPGETFAAYMDTVEVADSHRWTWVTVAGVSGWTADITEWTNGQTTPPDDAPPEPPEDAPDNEALERILLEIEILKARIVALESRNEALETIVAGAGHILVSVNGKES